VGVLLVPVPAALYLVAILMAGSAPVASLVISVGAIVLYFIAILVDRLTATSGRRRTTSPEARPIGLVASDLCPRGSASVFSP
jgi:hypothetical protein